ncbi:hypothetical protein [Stenotrophomonas sp. P5_B8]
MLNDQDVEQSIYCATMLVRRFVCCEISARSFVESYGNFYYYEALDGHEASSALNPAELAKLKFAVELHRRIQEQVVNALVLDSPLSAEALKAAGRLLEPDARAHAQSICAEVGLDALLASMSVEQDAGRMAP